MTSEFDDRTTKNRHFFYFFGGVMHFVTCISISLSSSNCEWSMKVNASASLFQSLFLLKLNQMASFCSSQLCEYKRSMDRATAAPSPRDFDECPLFSVAPRL